MAAVSTRTVSIFKICIPARMRPNMVKQMQSTALHLQSLRLILLLVWRTVGFFGPMYPISWIMRNQIYKCSPKIYVPRPLPILAGSCCKTAEFADHGLPVNYDGEPGPQSMFFGRGCGFMKAICNICVAMVLDNAWHIIFHIPYVCYVSMGSQYGPNCMVTLWCKSIIWFRMGKQVLRLRISGRNLWTSNRSLCPVPIWRRWRAPVHLLYHGVPYKLLYAYLHTAYCTYTLQCIAYISKYHIPIYNHIYIYTHTPYIYSPLHQKCHLKIPTAAAEASYA